MLRFNGHSGFVMVFVLIILSVLSGVVTYELRAVHLSIRSEKNWQIRR